MYYVCVLFVTVSAGSCTHSLHTGGTVQWKSITLMCRPTFRGKNPFLVKIQYVDGCKGECIIYLQRCRNYNKLLVVPTDSLNSVGAHELLTLIDTEYDCMDMWYSPMNLQANLFECSYFFSCFISLNIFSLIMVLLVLNFIQCFISI